MMFGNFQLIHTSKRKTVLFNACQFSRVPISDGVLHSYENMHFWGMFLLLSYVFSFDSTF